MGIRELLYCWRELASKLDGYESGHTGRPKPAIPPKEIAH